MPDLHKTLFIPDAVNSIQIQGQFLVKIEETEN